MENLRLRLKKDKELALARNEKIEEQKLFFSKLKAKKRKQRGKAVKMQVTNEMSSNHDTNILATESFGNDLRNSTPMNSEVHDDTVNNSKHICSNSGEKAVKVSKKLKHNVEDKGRKVQTLKNRKNLTSVHNSRIRRQVRDRVRKHRAKMSEEDINKKKEKDREYRRMQKIDKPISELSEREKRSIRKKWKERSKRYRENKKRTERNENFVAENTPPSSADEPLAPVEILPPISDINHVQPKKNIHVLNCISGSIVSNNSKSKKFQELKEIKRLLQNPPISVGSWIAAAYDDMWYPGVVERVLSGKYEINFMGRQGRKFYWPAKPDIQELSAEEVLCKINGPIPAPGSSRTRRFHTFDTTNVKIAENELSKTIL